MNNVKPNMKRVMYIYEVGTKWPAHNGHDVAEIVEVLDDDKFLVKFGTSSTKVLKKASLRKCRFQDDYRPKLYGRGFMGQPNRSDPAFKASLQLWQNMMKRCYSEKDDKGYFGSVVVCPRWHSFENFIADLKNLKNFQQWFNKQGYQIDKDYRGDGTIYSPDTCMFVTAADNKREANARRVGRKLTIPS